jgi:hypothetical protein
MAGKAVSKMASASKSDDGIPEGACSAWHPCQVFAIAERKGNLTTADLELWKETSSSCNRACPFNKLGREERSLESKRVVSEQAVQMDMEAVRDNGRDWTTCT